MGELLRLVSVPFCLSLFFGMKNDCITHTILHLRPQKGPPGEMAAAAMIQFILSGISSGSICGGGPNDSII